MQHFNPDAGNYTQVSNDLMDLLASPVLNATEKSVLAVVLRFTAGWIGYEGKTPFVEVNLPISVLVASTGRSEMTVVRALAMLQQYGVLIAVKKGGGKEQNRYCLNYGRDTWQLKAELPKIVPSRDYYSDCRRTSDVTDGATDNSSDINDRATDNSKTAQNSAVKNDRGGSNIDDRGGSNINDRAKSPQTLAVASVAPTERNLKKTQRKIPPKSPQGDTAGGEDRDLEEVEILFGEPRTPSVIDWIMELDEEGFGGEEIAIMLNHHGIPTERGGKWSGPVVNYLRQEEKQNRDRERRKREERAKLEELAALADPRDVNCGRSPYSEGGITATTYGYRAEGDIVVEDEREQSVIAEIITSADAGLEPKVIAEWLNQQRFPAKRGGKWYSNTVTTILKREAKRVRARQRQETQETESRGEVLW